MGSTFLITLDIPLTGLLIHLGLQCRCKEEQP